MSVRLANSLLIKMIKKKLVNFDNTQNAVFFLISC